MKQVLINYSIISFLVGFVFVNFVACGTNYYLVSLDDDTEIESTSAGNPDVANPESAYYGIHATRGWVKLPIRYRFGSQLTEEQTLHLEKAMDTWEQAVGRKLFLREGVHEQTTGDSFTDLYSSLQDQVNGHYLDDNWAKTNKPDYVLATTIWQAGGGQSTIGTADIRFNNQSYVIGDSLSLTATDGKEVVDMQSLALHELGHLLGLAHVDPDVDSHSIMNPTLFIGEGLISRQISEGDIQRIQKIYGCEGEDRCNPKVVMERIQRSSDAQGDSQEVTAH